MANFINNMLRKLKISANFAFHYAKKKGRN